MQATYVPTSFQSEDDKSNQCIRILKKYYKGKALLTKLPGLNNEGYDMTIVFMSNLSDLYTLEIKSNAGCSSTGFMYKTWLVETYADNAMERMPEWRTTDGLDFLIIFNRATKQAHIYDVNKLRDYVAANESAQVPSGTGTGQYNKTNKLCSWGLKIPWECEEAGHLKTLNLASYWD